VQRPMPRAPPVMMMFLLLVDGIVVDNQWRGGRIALVHAGCRLEGRLSVYVSSRLFMLSAERSDTVLCVYLEAIFLAPAAGYDWSSDYLFL
jgi:hypothetical protein